MSFRALIGGIYRRTDPRTNTGDWFSVMGNIQGTENHNIAYCTVANVVLGGAQDNGSELQDAPGDTTWTFVMSGDGDQHIGVFNPGLF